MIDFTFDVEAKKDTLAQFVGDKLQVWGAVSNVENIQLRKLLFADQHIPNKEALLKAQQDYLAAAQSNGMNWLNEIQPELSAVPQSFINYGTLFAKAIPAIRQAIRKDTQENREKLKQLFNGLSLSSSEQLETLHGTLSQLNDKLQAFQSDAEHFSEGNENFSALEKIDSDNLKEAQAAIAKLTKRIEEYNKDITKKMIKEEEDMTISNIVMSVGGLLGKPGESLGLAIGLIFIVSAGLTLNEVLSEIDAAFQAAMKEAAYKVEVTELNEQLLALHATSSALNMIVTELKDMGATLKDIISIWTDLKQTMDKAINVLNDTSQPLDQIISEFNLGRASAEWEDAVFFAQRMQKNTVMIGTQTLVTPDPNDSAESA